VRKIKNAKHLILLTGICFLTIFHQPLPCQPSDYITLETTYCVFFFVAEDNIAVQRLADNATDIVEGILNDLGVDFPGTIKVYIADKNAFHEIQPTTAIFPDSIVGVAYANLSLIVLKSPREVSGLKADLLKTFIHELTHIILGSAFKGEEQIPQWLNEGIALYVSREWSFNRVTGMTRAVLTDSMIPLSDLTHRFPENPRDLQLAYAQSFYLVSFLITRFGRESFHTFIRLYSQNKDLEKTLFQVYSLSLEELENEWKSFLEMRFSWIPLITSSTTLWFIITLIFVYGYLNKKRKMKGTLKQWEEDELQ
jgi:hypothetical protein